MSRPLRITLGVLAGWATLYALAALSLDLSLAGPGNERPLPERVALLVSGLNALVVLAIFGGRVFGTETMPALNKVGWLFGMLFFFPLAVPAYWYRHVWRAPL